MTIVEPFKNARPKLRHGLPSLARTITSALAGRRACVGVRYNGVSSPLPSVRATRPGIGLCSDTSAELQAELHSWIFLTMAYRLPVIELDMPMNDREPRNTIGEEPIAASEIVTLRTDLQRVFQKSGRLTDDEGYVDLLLRVGLRSEAPLVQVLSFSEERPTPWEDMQVYGLLSAWISRRRSWFAGVETLGLAISVGNGDTEPFAPRRDQD